jgi:hypothetical protein
MKTLILLENQCNWDTSCHNRNSDSLPCLFPSCIQMAVHFYIFRNLNNYCAYRCNRHKWGTAEIEEISFEEALVLDVMKS